MQNARWWAIRRTAEVRQGRTAAQALSDAQ